MEQSAQRPPHMHQWDIRDANDLPLRGSTHPNSDDLRKTTDVCCLVVGILFGLVLFITACAVYNGANLKKGSYPTDSSGKVCMLDTNTGQNNYPFVYFNDLENPSTNR
jgi:hypothetical protein